MSDRVAHPLGTSPEGLNTDIWISPESSSTPPLVLDVDPMQLRVEPLAYHAGLQLGDRMRQGRQPPRRSRRERRDTRHLMDGPGNRAQDVDATSAGVGAKLVIYLSWEMCRVVRLSEPFRPSRWADPPCA